MPQFSLQILADAGPNTFINGGSGASQTARLLDAVESNNIRAATLPVDSRFTIDPAGIPPGVQTVTQITLSVRDHSSIGDTVNYRIYNNAALVSSKAVIRLVGEPLTDHVYTLFDSGETMIGADLPNLRLGFTAPGYINPGFWHITKVYELLVTYAAASGQTVCVDGSFSYQRNVQGSFKTQRDVRGFFRTDRLGTGSIPECDD